MGTCKIICSLDGQESAYELYGGYTLPFTHKCQLLSNVGRLYNCPDFAKERGEELR